MPTQALQERYSPDSICFGCGPANEAGLHIKSFPINEHEAEAHWQAQPQHQAAPGILNGGIIGTLLDCHCNWTAAWHLMNLSHATHPPATVTASYSIKLLRPTPSDKVLHIVSKVVETDGRRVTVEGELRADGKTCATCRGLFVAVEPGHPAYTRW